MSTPGEPITLAFVGYANAALAERAAAFEGEVLAILERHGGRVLYRGRRVGDDEVLPAEIHLLWFPARDALAAYLDDDRRKALVSEYGEVFAVKHAVEVEAVAPPPARPRFVVVREPGPAWDHGKPMRQQAGWDEHAEFMDALAAEGFIALGGPLTSGALHVVSAASEEQAAERFGDDPWTAMGLLRTARVERWEILLGGLP